MTRIGLVLMAVLLTIAAAAETLRAAHEPARAGPNHVVDVPGPINADNSPSLARNPRRPGNLALTYRVDRPGYSAALAWSQDGGAVWQATALPLPLGLDRPFGPDVAFGPDGTLYVSYVNLAGNGNAPDGLWLARSTDGGRTLSPPVRVSDRLAFQVRIAVGPDGTVYVTWLQAGSVAINRLVGFPNPVVVSRSLDGGRTFSAPVPVSDPGRQRVGAASPVVDAHGRLFVLYEDFKDDRRDFEYLEGPAAETPFSLVITWSDDQGRSFAPGIDVDTDLTASHRFLVFLPDFPSLALGPQQQLYVAWADGRHGDEDVFLRRSDDRGRTWSPAVRVNDNRHGDGTDQYLPRVAVAPSGRVDVLFLDRRRDPRHNVMTDAFLARSGDGGRSFTNIRVSSRSFDSTVGPSVAGFMPVDFGSRIGLAGSDGASLAAWTDSRFGSQDTGRQDIVFAVVGRRAVTIGELIIVVGLWLLAAGTGVLTLLSRPPPDTARA